MSQDTILKQVLTCFGIQGVTLGIVPQSEFLQSGLHHLHCETRLQVHMHACGDITTQKLLQAYLL